MLSLITLQLIFLGFLLIVAGEPLRFFLLRRLKFFSDLDFLQICILDIYLGGFALYVIAMLPLRLFSWPVIVGFTVVTVVTTISVHFNTWKRAVNLDNTRAFLRENRKAVLECLVVLGIFFTFLVINLVPASGFVFGSVRDESIHSLSVQVILQNSQVPVTLHPYLEEGIIYPQASHVVFAFSTYMLNMDVPKVVFYVTIFFKALSILGAYFLGKKLGSALYGLGLSFIFAFLSNWPLSLVWGGNPFLVGFPLFLVCLGLLFSLARQNARLRLTEIVFIGLLFGYVGAIIISYLEILLVIAFFILVYYLARKLRGTRYRMLSFAAVFSISFVPLSPFLFRFFAFYQYPGHNLGIPSDFAGWSHQQVYIGQALQWAFENLSPYSLLRALTIVFLAGLAIFICRTKDHANVKPLIAFALAIFVSATFLSFVSFLLPADFGVVSWGHQGILLSVSISILLISFYAELTLLCQRFRVNRLSGIFSKSSRTTIFLTIAILSIVTAPFVYYRFLVDPESLRGGYNMFAVTTQNDYNLMLWMKENLTSSAVILVHPYGAGEFIPSVSYHKVVFPYSGSGLGSSYQTVVSLLGNNTLSPTVYAMMHYLNISHVFVGAEVAYPMSGNPKWDPELFLGNPNFKLIKNVGDAYLFKLEEDDLSTVFLDDFEYASWKHNRWHNDSFGSGLGNVDIADGGGYDDSGCLRITAQAMPKIWEWAAAKYVYWVNREIFVMNNSDVAISFYLNATEGFDLNDTFALIVSDVANTRSMVVTTPNGVYGDYANAITLDGYQGIFNISLSREWQTTFNSSLPCSFVLQLANYDFDGITNVADIDNIQVMCNLA